MAEPSLSFPEKMRPNQIFISGRIDYVSKYENKFDHIIITPAADAYSKPSQTRVSSTQKLGGAGDDIRVLAAYNGWSNNYKNKDGDMVHDVRGFFVAVE